MPIVSINLSDDIDKKVSLMKIEKDVGSKSQMIVDILQDYFKNINSMEIINDLKSKVEAQNKIIDKFKIDV